jgi:hypothetical protein
VCGCSKRADTVRARNALVLRLSLCDVEMVDRETRRHGLSFSVPVKDCWRSAGIGSPQIGRGWVPRCCHLLTGNEAARHLRWRQLIIGAVLPLR